MAFATVSPVAARLPAPRPTTPAPLVRRSSAVPRSTDTTPALHLGPARPLAPPVRQRLERTFGRDLSRVRVQENAGAAAALGTKAFAFGPTVILGAQARADDLGLMAHEVAHTLQQSDSGAARSVQRFSTGSGAGLETEAQRASGAATRGETFTVTGRTGGPTPQGLFGIPNPLDWIADKANIIPGFRMFTILLGVNPINMSRVERSAANILRALIEFIPGGGLITQALDNHGVFEKVGAWVSDQVQTLGLSVASIKKSISDFIDSLGLSDLANLGGVWDRAKRIFTDPIDRIITFAKNLVIRIVTFIKNAILIPIAKLASGTPGYDLLKAVLGKDPVTGETVPRTPENLIGPFMKLIGQQEIWENMKKANAIPRAWTWFQGALTGLLGFVAQVPALFIAAFTSLELADIILVPRAFAKIVGVFGSFMARFVSWAGNAVWNLLQIIFEVVAPGAMPYLKKVGGALRSIFKAPIVFVGNLVRAGKLGFERFAEKIGTHLKNSLIEWLTGSLPGVHIPKSLEVTEILKFVLSVLGLTWANIRQKLVKVIGETAVKVLETGFDLVKKLVTEGPAAAWEHIKEMLSDLKNTVMNGIINFIVTNVVKKAVVKIVSFLIPGAAFIQAIITIYDTIMVFVDKLKKIIQVVTTFLDSMMAIASGAVEGAAKKVETTLAGLLTLAISFLAGFAGLGKVADKVMEIIQKIRAPIDKAIDKLIAVIVKLGQKIFASAKAGVKKLLNWWKAKKPFAAEDGEKHTLSLERKGAGGRILIASQIQPYTDFINSLSIPNNKQTEKKAALTIAAELDKVMNKAAAASTSTAAPSNADPAKEIEPLLDKLATATVAFLPANSNKSSDAVYGPLVAGFGSSVRVARLAKKQPKGGEPSVSDGFWQALRRRQDGGGTYYVRGHLLNHNIGGPGNSWTNLTPLTQSANNRAKDSMLNKFETPVKTTAGGLKSGEGIHFVVTARYARSHPLLGTVPNLLASGNPDDAVIADIIKAEQYVPVTIECRANRLTASGTDGASVATATIDNKIEDKKLADYHLTPQPKKPLVVSEASESELTQLKGITPARAKLIFNSRPYRNSAQVRTAANLTESQWEAAVRTSGYHVRLFKIT